MSALADSSKRWHIVLRGTICGPLGLLFLIGLIFGMHESCDNPSPLYYAVTFTFDLLQDHFLPCDEPQFYECLLSVLFYFTFLSHLFPLPCRTGSTVPREGFDSSVTMPFSWCVVAVTLPI